jgi:hypothetical protein
VANKNDSDLIRIICNMPPLLSAEYFAQNAHRIIDDANYWNVLGTLWKIGGTVVQQSLWLPLFLSDRPKRQKIMKSSERRKFRRLPKVVKAYRAVNSDDEILTAISWSLDRKVATMFSEDGKRKIVCNYFFKGEIFAFFDRQSEDEILVNILNKKIAIKPHAPTGSAGG